MAGDVVVVCEVLAGREGDLQEHLRGLDESSGPLGAMTQATHFARFVVLPLDGHQLFFSSRFDGEPAPYLRDLAAQPAAQAIWAFCDAAAAADATRLLPYLERHIVKAPYVLAAWPQDTVAQVNAAVRRRAQLQRFALRAGGLDPVGLAHAFREEFRAVRTGGEGQRARRELSG